MAQPLCVRTDSAQGLGPLAHGEDSQGAGKASLCTVGMSTSALPPKASGATPSLLLSEGPGLRAPNRLVLRT